MKKILFALAVLCCTGLAFLPEAARSQAPGQAGKNFPFDLGPGDKGATLKAPWQDADAAPTTSPSYIQGLLNTTGATKAGTTSSLHASLLPYDNTGINNDILVTRELGPWMILIISYAGPEGPIWARDMVRVLREQYKMPAYVYNYGAAEKRKEYERVKAIVEKQKQVLKENNLPLDSPIRIRHLRIDEHCGVLIGGYPTQEAALKVRDQWRQQIKENNLKAPDPTKVKLEVQFYEREDDPKDPKVNKKEAVWVNPFTRAMLVRNPAIKVDRPADWDKLDVAALKRMNAAEDFSLLKCNRNYTLAIKQFALPTMTGHRDEAPSGGFWDPFGMGKKSKDHTDPAADCAHDLVENLRKAKLEAFILHTKYYSLVTIGGYDSLEDPNLRSMQNILDTKLLPSPGMAGLQLFPTAKPMQIPK
jgi:hypothetical protein